ncbi:hypothetical protein ACFVYA_23495 [Amycolatopsis sp. NPDC058278]|uniref:hypothetical protein n=1 Tax=Amycolatopsis sp. NPDC058278 TaxID=3346417 RepID=UPI0036D91FC9
MGYAGGSGMILGSLLGGVLTQASGWAAVFFVNVPPAAAAAALAFPLPARDPAPEPGRRFDLPRHGRAGGVPRRAGFGPGRGVHADVRRGGGRDPGRGPGVASGVASTAPQIGGSVGLAVFVAVANASTHRQSGEALRVATVDGLRTAVLLAAAGIALTAVAALRFRGQGQAVAVPA